MPTQMRVLSSLQKGWYWNSLISTLAERGVTPFARALFRMT
jgi:hypothetical protein